MSKMSPGTAARGAALFGFALLSCAGSAWAAGELLGLHPRPSGMGGAYTAVADDHGAVVYNPAGLARTSRAEVSLVYIRPFTGVEDLKLWNGIGTVSARAGRWGTAGFSWAETNLEDLYRERSLIFSYAKGFSLAGRGLLYMGGNLRQTRLNFLLDERTRGDPVFLSGSARSAWTWDAGLLYVRSETSGLRAGLSVLDASRSNLGFREEVRQPRTLRLGVSWRFDKVPKLPMTVTPAFDAAFVEGRKEYFVGVEAWDLKGLFGLRAGGNMSGTRGREAAMGASVIPLKKTAAELRFDYVFFYPLELKETTGSHGAGLSFRFP